ncbi:MAG: GAF domain-containing protein, partial [Pseudomonadota bacterium]
MPIRETARDISFCAHAILGKDVFVVEDARLDPRFADNPLVTNEPHIAFYAGRPLRNAENFTVGTLCIIDSKPRHFSHEDRRTLDDLGYWVEQIFYGRQLGEAEKEILNELDEARRNSMLDPMLNIWTQSAVIYLYEREVLRSFRNKRPISVLILAVEHEISSGEDKKHLKTEATLIEAAKRLYVQRGRSASPVIAPESGANKPGIGGWTQLKRDVPYATIVQAFDDLVTQLLASSEESIGVWKRRILDAVGENGSLLV